MQPRKSCLIPLNLPEVLHRDFGIAHQIDRPRLEGPAQMAPFQYHLWHFTIPLLRLAVQARIIPTAPVVKKRVPEYQPQPLLVVRMGSGVMGAFFYLCQGGPVGSDPDLMYGGIGR